MLDIAWSELMVIAVVALVFIGPKDLPKAIFTLGKWVRKARLVARDFQGHLDTMVREAELDDLRQEALKARDLNLKKMVENTIDPTGQMRDALDVGLTGKPLDPTPSPTPSAVNPAAVEPPDSAAPVTVGQPEILAPEPEPEALAPPVLVPTPPEPAAIPAAERGAPAAKPAGTDAGTDNGQVAKTG